MIFSMPHEMRAGAEHGGSVLYSQLLGRWRQEYYNCKASLGKVRENLSQKQKYE
jgi:hypothetical protein